MGSNVNYNMNITVSLIRTNSYSLRTIYIAFYSMQDQSYKKIIDKIWEKRDAL